MQRYAKHNAPIILEPDETLAFSLDCHSKPNRITLERNVKTAYLVSFVCFLSFGGIWAVSKRLQRIFPQSPQTVQQRSQIFDRVELQFLRTGFNWNYRVIILHWALCSISHSLSTGNEFSEGEPPRLNTNGDLIGKRDIYIYRYDPLYCRLQTLIQPADSGLSRFGWYQASSEHLAKGGCLRLPKAGRRRKEVRMESISL